MKNKKLFILVGVILFIGTILTLFISTYESSNLKIITTKDSIAYKYAKDKNLKLEILSESEATNYKKNIETYTYNKINSGIEITGYDGISQELIIPNEIDGYRVLSIHEGAFKNNNITQIAFPNSIVNIKDEDFKDIKIVCYQTQLCVHLKSLDDYDITILNDSDNYNFNLDKLEFEYNKDNTYELTKYKGLSNDIIVPDYINGYKVEKLSFDVDNNIKSIYIPETITKIDLNILDTPFNSSFFIIILFDTIALLAFIVINLLVSNKNLSENFNSAPIRMFSIIYLILEFIHSFYIKFGNYKMKTFILVSIISLIIYIFVSVLLLESKKKIEKYDNKIKNVDKFIKNTLILINDIDTDNYDEPVKDEIKKLKDLIKYSDPVSNDEVKDIETEIVKLIKETNLRNAEDIKKINKLIEKRNNIIKNNK